MFSGNGYSGGKGGFMKRPTGIMCHECAPKEFRNTPQFTGSHELDAVIHRSKNKNLADRMKMFAPNVGEETLYGNDAYGPRTAYNGYSGYKGDD